MHLNRLPHLAAIDRRDVKVSARIRIRTLPTDRHMDYRLTHIGPCHSLSSYRGQRQATSTGHYVERKFGRRRCTGRSRLGELGFDDSDRVGPGLQNSLQEGRVDMHRIEG